MNKDLFINCPFSDDYWPLFQGVIFISIYCGFFPRCALEADDSSSNRFEKICDLIGQCDFGFHDISKVELDGKSKLPRFNMPLELGLFLAAKKFGNKRQRQKSCVIFDSELYRYQKFISDISGQDIHAHHGKLAVMIDELTKWFQGAANDHRIPGGKQAYAKYKEFKSVLPKLAKAVHKRSTELTFFTYREFAVNWIKEDLELSAQT